jgi:hypothetical protein
VTYGVWNEKLIAHVFSRAENDGPVFRIPATPEELCIVAGRKPATMSSAEIDAVVADFVTCIKAELAAPKRGLLRYCLHYKEDPTWWGPNSFDQPYFFAMLWLTCLIAYGWPTDVEGDFYARMRVALDGSASLQGITLGELDDVWEDLEEWTGKRTENRPLTLPPRSAHRTIIGRSHFLAFPHRFDREKLAGILQAAGLAGHEPPVRMVLETLFAERERFSEGFRDDLRVLLSDYLEQGRDPKDSPFWRAVRQAARDLPAPGQVDGTSPGQAGLLAEWDADDLLTPFVAFSEDWVPPAEWSTEALELAVGKLSRRADLDAEEIAAVLESPSGILRAAEKRAIEEGFVPLLEEASGLYRLAVNEEIASCEIAFVRENVTAAIIRAFGGRADESGLPGWVLVTNGSFEQRDDLAADLSSIRTLLLTTDAPPPALVGGIRASGRTFYALEHYLPLVRARRASRVIVRPRDGEGEYSCVRAPSDADHWLLPEQVSAHSRTEGEIVSEYQVSAFYELDLLGRRVTRTSSALFCLQRPVLATHYKGLPSGSFRLETCAHDGESVTGPRASVPLGFTGEAFDRALDVLPFDASARWLGPGLGEMAIEARPDLPWLAVGPKNHPEYLVLHLKDAGMAPAPSNGSSPFVGDRRHWSRAFSKITSTWSKRDGAYTSEENWPPAARDLLRRYRARINDKPLDTVLVPETHLESRLRDIPWGVVGSSDRSVHDVLAASFQNRAGLPLREVHEHIGRVLDLGEAHVLREHLVRALVESGAVDCFLRSDGRQTVIVARTPRLMAYRRGPRWMAVLGGLTPSLVRKEFRAAVERLAGATIDERRTSNEHLPGSVRVSVGERTQLVDLSKDLGLVEPEYVEWADGAQLPQVFQVRGELRHDPVPDMYALDATWCWTSGSFRRTPESAGAVSVERRRDGHRIPIYVVCRDGVVLGWSYYRTWALLSAHEACGRRFLDEKEPGIFTVAGNSPLHLPLPLARLCAVVGLGAPGPQVSSTDPFAVEAYCYPLGSHLSRLLLPFLPSFWHSPPTH